MNNLPFFYEPLNAYNSFVSPSTVHVKNTALAQFFKRYLLQDAMTVFTWDMPDEWDRSYFLYVLYIIGFIGIMDTPEFGVIPQHGTLSGFNVFYRPKDFIVANPLFDKSYTLTINKDVTVLKLEPDYLGLYDIVDYYGDLMALAAETAGVNLLNSKLSFIFAADTKAAAESYKAAYDNYASGEPATVADKHLFDDQGNLRVQLFQQNVGQNFIVDKLLDVLRDIRVMFLTEIGIPNANTEKKERLIKDEVNANNFETRSKCALWLDELKKGCAQASEMFGIRLSVDWREDLKPEGGAEENGDAVSSGPV